MFEASRINYEALHEVKEQHLVHKEPTNDEKKGARHLISSFADFLCTKRGNHALLSQMLRYRCGSTDSLMENIYVFINIMLKKKCSFTFSPQYGLSLWPHAIGFQKFKALESQLKKNPHFFFNDFLSETTTFVIFHTDFRFKDIFEGNFRSAFFSQSLTTLLHLGAELNRLNLMKSIIKSSITMYQINEL